MGCLDNLTSEYRKDKEEKNSRMEEGRKRGQASVILVMWKSSIAINPEDNQ